MLALLGFGLVACGGSDGSSDGQDAEVVATATETGSADETEAETTEAETTETEPAEAAGPAPAPGKGWLELDDGRVFAITITECKFQPSDGSPAAGSFEVRGTSDKGSEFDMTQFFLNGKWSQSDASVQFPNRDQIYVLAFAAGDTDPATVDGKSISWTQTFKELDESANAHVYTGEGGLRLTCP